MTAVTSTSPDAALSRVRRGSALRAERMWAWILTLPALIHTLIWIGIPVIAAIAMSFTSYNIISMPRPEDLAKG